MRTGATALSTPQPLTREQAQAIADVIIGCDELCSWSIYDDLRARFPQVEWMSLCEPDAADPRERIPRPAFIGPRMPNEASRVMDRNIKLHLDYVNRELSSKPSILMHAFGDA
jgi:hypothetical protein